MAETEKLNVRDDGDTKQRVKRHAEREGYDNLSDSARDLIRAGETFLKVKNLFGLVVWAVLIMQLFVGAAIIIMSTVWWQSAAGLLLIVTAGLMFALWRSLEDDINGSE